MTMTAEQLAQLREVADIADKYSVAPLWGKNPAEMQRFLLLFTPAMAKSLLDELERKDKRIAELEKMAEAESIGADKAASSGVEWMKRCLAAEKRTAELEAREIVLPKPMKVLLSRSGETINAWPAYTVDSAIRAAGINLTVEGEG